MFSGVRSSALFVSELDRLLGSVGFRVRASAVGERRKPNKQALGPAGAALGVRVSRRRDRDLTGRQEWAPAGHLGKAQLVKRVTSAQVILGPGIESGARLPGQRGTGPFLCLPLSLCTCSRALTKSKNKQTNKQKKEKKEREKKEKNWRLRS